MAARAPSFRLESPAPASAAHGTAAPTAPRPEPERARPLTCHGRFGRGLGLPLDAHQLRRLHELEQLVGARLLGWGREGDDHEGGRGLFFVDVLDADVSPADLKADGSGAGVERYTGDRLHQALGRALRAARGRP